MGRFWVLLLVVLLLVSVGVVAVKPTPQLSGGLGGITIVYTKAQAFKFGEDFDIYLHIFNSTDSTPLSNISSYNISCFLHIYNETDNEHILKGKFVYSSVDTFDWELEINHSIFSKTGFYPYIIFCNSSSVGGGFASDEFLISIDGEGELSSVSSMFLFAVILLPLLFGFLLIKWVSTLGDEHNVFKLFLSLLSVGTFFASVWFASLCVIKLFLWVSMSDALATLLLVYGIIYAVMIFYFLIYLLKSIFFGAMKNKDDKMEY
jgi:hypothetical protein